MNRDVFRCDYCGSLVELDDAETFFTPVEVLEGGDVLYVPATYCSPYCGRTATSRAGTGRG